MKKLSLVLLSAVLAANCHEEVIAPPLPSNTVEAMIDGSVFTARQFVIATHASNVLAIAALDDENRTINLAFVSPRQAAIVQVGAGERNSAKTNFMSQYWSSNLDGGSGTVTITTFSFTHAEGTFSYKAVAVPGTPSIGSRTVSGRFNVRFTIID